MKPKYSVVMPVLLSRQEHKSILEDCIASVKDNSKNYEFIIVDDGSPLLTGFLKEIADLYIRHNPKNWGIAPSWSDGMKVARGEFIVIINDDIRVKEGWLEGLEEALEIPKAGVAGPAVEHILHPPSGVEEKIEWFPGYCFMLRRETIETLKRAEYGTTEPYPGYFDENFVPFNGEDCDYWERLGKIGFTLVRNWGVEIWHAEGDTIHHMDYDKRSQEAIEQFKRKHGFDPRDKYYSTKGGVSP